MDSNATSSGGTPAPSLYPGESAPLTVITATDQSGVVLIGTALALIFAAISMLIRLYVRLEFRHNFAKDDLASLISMVGFSLRSFAVPIGVELTPWGWIGALRDSVSPRIYRGLQGVRQNY